MSNRLNIVALTFAGCASISANAQLAAPPITSALPSVSKISIANAAGVLKYCEQKDLVSSASTDAVLDRFATEPDVKSPDYVAGVGGEIHGDSGKNFRSRERPAICGRRPATWSWSGRRRSGRRLKLPAASGRRFP